MVSNNVPGYGVNGSSETVTSDTVTSSRKPLRENPFITYRDPQTGRWIVIKPAAA